MSENKPGKPDAFELKLYITGTTERSARALRNIERYCQENLGDSYSIDVVDLLTSPHLAEADEIFAIPTLVRISPLPVKRLIGDLSNEEKVLLALDLKPKQTMK